MSGQVLLAIAVSALVAAVVQFALAIRISRSLDLSDVDVGRARDQFLADLAAAMEEEPAICDHCGNEANHGAICGACAWKEPDPDAAYDTWRDER